MKSLISFILLLAVSVSSMCAQKSDRDSLRSLTDCPVVDLSKTSSGPKVFDTYVDYLRQRNSSSIVTEANGVMGIYLVTECVNDLGKSGGKLE